MVAMERLFFPRLARFSDAYNSARVVEPELDMQRAGRVRRSAIVERVRALMRWLMPAGRSTAPPMRSIDRELWETSNDR